VDEKELQEIKSRSEEGKRVLGPLFFLKTHIGKTSQRNKQGIEVATEKSKAGGNYCLQPKTGNQKGFERLKRFIWMVVIIYSFAFPHSPSAKQHPDQGQGRFGIVAISNADTFTCLGCHDGALARNVTSPYQDPAVSLGPLSTVGYGDHQGNHPIGMDYAASFLKKRSALRPMAALPLSVRLEDGRVGCISCHNSSSSPPAKLALANERSTLCVACHNL
jgi:predicted CXXCH cytochrome family protein